MVVVCTTIIILTVRKMLNQNTVVTNEQYEVQLNNYGYLSKQINVLDDELKKTVKEVQVEEIYDVIDNLSIEDPNIENPYDFISDIPLQHSTSTLQNESSASTDDLLDNYDDYVSMKAVVIRDKLNNHLYK